MCWYGKVSKIYLIKKSKVQNIVYGIDALCVICFTYSGVCIKFRFVP